MKNNAKKFPLPEGDVWFRLPEKVSQISEKLELVGLGEQGPVGPQGPQGEQGPAGPLGPVGPAGLTWQGAWDADTSYVEDDAVGYNGASWFCISDVSGTGNDDPSIDTAHWALLASQGAQGEQGIQGPAGPQGPSGSATKTFSSLYGGSNANPTLLTADVNTLLLGAGSANIFKLPSSSTNPYLGKEIKVVSASGNTLYIQSAGANEYISTSAQGFSGQVQIEFNEVMVFTYVGNGFWSASAELRAPLKISGKTVGDGINNNVNLLLTNTQFTSAPTASQLNVAYNNFYNVIGLKVVCTSIVGGPLMFIKTGFSSWVSVPVSVVS